VVSGNQIAVLPLLDPVRRLALPGVASLADLEDLSGNGSGRLIGRSGEGHADHCDWY